MNIETGVCDICGEYRGYLSSHNSVKCSEMRKEIYASGNKDRKPARNLSIKQADAMARMYR